MIEYFEQLTQEEQEDLTDVIRLLYRQTFLLERKFDKRAGRLQYQREYRICEKHIDFLKMYFQIAGITLCENVHLGLIYIQDEMVWGEKLPRLATIYILLLKLIYDEQMASVSSSSQIVTTLGALNGKAGDFRVLRSIPSPTEMKRTVYPCSIAGRCGEKSSGIIWKQPGRRGGDSWRHWITGSRSGRFQKSA